MHGCPQLSKLPKTSRVSSVIFRRQTPGSILVSKRVFRPEIRLDPEHPIYRDPERPGPIIWTRNTAFSLGATPMALLLQPGIAPKSNGGVEVRHRARIDTPFESWAARVARGQQSRSGTVAPMQPINPRPGRIAMSMQLQTFDKVRTNQRSRVARRFKFAVGLIVARGTDTANDNGRLRLVFDPENVPEEWILQGWTYTLRWTLALYRMPYPELVRLLRPMLREIWTSGTAMEARWAALDTHASSHERPKRQQAMAFDRSSSRAGRARTSYPDRDTTSEFTVHPNFDRSPSVRMPSSPAALTLSNSRNAKLKAPLGVKSDDGGSPPSAEFLISAEVDPIPPARDVPFTCRVGPDALSTPRKTSGRQARAPFGLKADPRDPATPLGECNLDALGFPAVRDVRPRRLASANGDAIAVDSRSPDAAPSPRAPVRFGLKANDGTEPSITHDFALSGPSQHGARLASAGGGASADSRGTARRISNPGTMAPFGLKANTEPDTYASERGYIHVDSRDTVPEQYISRRTNAPSRLEVNDETRSSAASDPEFDLFVFPSAQDVPSRVPAYAEVDSWDTRRRRLSRSTKVPFGLRAEASTVPGVDLFGSLSVADELSGSTPSTGVDARDTPRRPHSRRVNAPFGLKAGGELPPSTAPSAEADLDIFGFPVAQDVPPRPLASAGNADPRGTAPRTPRRQFAGRMTAPSGLKTNGDSESSSAHHKEPDFDLSDFPSAPDGSPMHSESVGARADPRTDARSSSGRWTNRPAGLKVDADFSVHPQKTFDPLPSHRPSDTEIPSPTYDRHTKTADTNWWALGRTIRAGLDEVAEEGSTRWDQKVEAESSPPGHKQSSAVAGTPELPKKETTQSRLKNMLYRPNEVVRPDSKQRAAGRTQIHTFGEK